MNLKPFFAKPFLFFLLLLLSFGLPPRFIPLEAQTPPAAQVQSEAQTPPAAQVQPETQTPPEAQTPVEALVLVNPPEAAEPFSEAVRAWFHACPNAAVSDFAAGNCEDQGVPLTLSWACRLPGVTRFQVSCVPRNGKAKAWVVTVLPSETPMAQPGAGEKTGNSNHSLSLPNLLRGTAYDWKVTAITSDGSAHEAASTFRTGDLAPRVILVDGIHNVRDLGGYSVSFGKKIRQGLLFRGSEMNGKHGIRITEAGVRTMTEELGIRTDLDLRSPSEALHLTESPLGSRVKLVFLPIGNYTAAFTSPNYPKIFSLMAIPENYPIYFHCWGGADRTGTVAFLLGALLGVSEEELTRDFEFTSFSVFGIRDSKKTNFNFQGLREALQAYGGSTLAEKAENYMLSIGVTSDEIQSIRKILLE